VRWRTRLDPAYCRRFGSGAPLHIAAFRHLDDPGGVGRCVALQVPE
jgi:hypothetical protein